MLLGTISRIGRREAKNLLEKLNILIIEKKNFLKIRVYSCYQAGQMPPQSYCKLVMTAYTNLLLIF